MKLFDLHADIGYDVIMQKRKGNHGVIKKTHMDKFAAGDIAYVGMASNFEGKETWKDMQEMVTTLRTEIELCDDLDLVTHVSDFHDNTHRKALLTIEGMCGIKQDPIAKLHWLYEQGVRIASLCWNDENMLATGVRGNQNRGLSDMGKQVVREMIRLNMPIDVSHANETTFWDIMELQPKLVLATHSNVYTLCEHPRNLKTEQIKAIADHGGIIGVVSAPMFIAMEKQEQTVANLITHVTALKTLVGIDAIAVGFDFMDFYENYDANLNDMPSCTLAQNFVQALRSQGFSESEMKKICYENAIRFVKQAYS